MLRRSPMKRSGRLKARNPKRQASNFARAYHSHARVLFVRGLRCAACSHRGSVNAHLLGNDGMGRKASYDTIGPLCATCHAMYDEHRAEFVNRFPYFDAKAIANDTEQAFRDALGATA